MPICFCLKASFCISRIKGLTLRRTRRTVEFPEVGVIGEGEREADGGGDVVRVEPLVHAAHRLVVHILNACHVDREDLVQAPLPHHGLLVTRNCTHT